MVLTTLMVRIEPFFVILTAKTAHLHSFSISYILLMFMVTQSTIITLIHVNYYVFLYLMEFSALVIF